MNFWLGCLIVAFAGDSAQPSRHPDAVEVFHCAFDDRWDKNFDDWPDNWTRQQGPGYPPYLQMGLRADGPGARSFRMKLDGGAAAVHSPAIPVDARYSYVLETKMHVVGLKHNRAYLSVTFYDAKRKPLETIAGERLTATDGWKPIHLGPLSPRDGHAVTAVIGLHLVPGSSEDLTGTAAFDDIWLARLPRMTLQTNSAHNVYADPKGIEVTCALSGVVERQPEICFELIDATGVSVAQSTERLRGELIGADFGSPAVRPDGAVTPAGYAGKVRWRPALKEFGYYRLRATMHSSQGADYVREVGLAVVCPLEMSAQGEFGWTLPHGDKPLSLDTLLTLLPHAGIHWLKFPVWFGEHDHERGERLMRFTERLGSKGIELVGLLDKLPGELDETFGDGSGLSAANIFSADPKLWLPSLDPVMTRLSLKIRWWQLGGDHDVSFVGYPDLAKKIAEIKKQLYRFGQEVHLGLGWSWLAETLPSDVAAAPAIIREAADGGSAALKAAQQPRGPKIEPKHASPWDFLTMSANPPLTGAEMASYLENWPSGPTRRWVLVEPLARSHYATDVRARDLVEQMLAAKIKAADGIFLPNPFSSEFGVMNDDATPSELFLPWRTTAMTLGGTKYLGSVRLPGGSQNHVFSRGGEAVMVVWNEKPTQEVLYLGDKVRQIDIWGRLTEPEQRAHEQVISVGWLPTFVTGVNEQVALWRMAVRFEQTSIPSVFGTEHANGIYLKNFFPQGAGGTIELHTPKVWKTFPRTMNFKLAAGEEMVKPFAVELKFEASSGRQEIRIDFDINVDRHYKFSVYRDLEVGLGDIEIEVGTKLQENGSLVVEQRMVNHTDALADFKCLLYAPERRRQSTQVFRLGRGQDIKRYVLADGKDLVGKTLWLRAEEIGGLRILNYRFVVEP